MRMRKQARTHTCIHMRIHTSARASTNEHTAFSQTHTLQITRVHGSNFGSPAKDDRGKGGHVVDHVRESAQLISDDVGNLSYPHTAPSIYVPRK